MSNPLVTGKAQKSRLRTVDLAIVAMLIAVGAVLRVASPPLGTITPNWMISLYVLAIMLVRPNLQQAIGIGLVAGAVCVPTSKAPIPWVTLVSEPVGALVAAMLLGAFARISDKRFPFKAIVIAAMTTVISGTVFVAVTKLLIPQKAVVAVMMGTVGITALANSIITQLLYYPAKRMISLKGTETDEPRH
jgi:energy-coupling factor transport system ATP-binding protein